MDAWTARERILALTPVNGVKPVDIGADTRIRLCRELRDYLDKEPDAFIPTWLLEETEHKMNRKKNHVVLSDAQMEAVQDLDKALLYEDIIDLVKDAGGWEAGPRGGTRRKLPSGKWQYKRGSSGGSGKAEKKEDGGEEQSSHGQRSMEAVAEAMDKLPDGWSVTTEDGVKFTKKDGKWYPEGSDEPIGSEEFVDKETDKNGGDKDKAKKEFNGSKLKLALWAFLENFIPGKDKDWKIQVQERAGHTDEDEKKDEKKDKKGTEEAEKAEEDKADDSKEEDKADAKDEDSKEKDYYRYPLGRPTKGSKDKDKKKTERYKPMRDKLERHPDAPKGYEPDPKSSNNAHVDKTGRKWYPPPQKKETAKKEKTKKSLSFSDALHEAFVQMEEAKKRR